MPDGPATEPAVTRARRSQEEAVAPAGTLAETTDSSRTLDGTAIFAHMCTHERVGAERRRARTHHTGESISQSHGSRLGGRGWNSSRQRPGAMGGGQESSGPSAPAAAAPHAASRLPRHLRAHLPTQVVATLVGRRHVPIRCLRLANVVCTHQRGMTDTVRRCGEACRAGRPRGAPTHARRAAARRSSACVAASR